MTGLLLVAFTVVVPATFFLGIVLRVTRQASDAGGIRRIHTEPIVLLLIGFWFLAANSPYIENLSIALEYRLQISAGGTVLASENGLRWFRFCFGTGMIALLATLAKAFWTHVVLEDNEWGGVQRYREMLPSGFVSGFEYVIRCLIAVLIVVTQKELTGVGNISFIDDVNAIRGDEERSQIFSQEFATWLQGFAALAFYIYAAILVWVVIVFSYTRSDPKASRAAKGTLWSTAPALAVVWIMYFLASGNFIPIPFVSTLPANVESWVAWSFTSILFLLSVAIFWNVLWTLSRGPLAEATLAVRRKKTAKLPLATGADTEDDA